MAGPGAGVLQQGRPDADGGLARGRARPRCWICGRSARRTTRTTSSPTALTRPQLITTLDDARRDRAEHAVAPRRSRCRARRFAAARDTGPWDQLALAPLTCLLYAGSPRATGQGMEWTLEAAENVDRPEPGGGFRARCGVGRARRPGSRTRCWRRGCALCWKWRPSNGIR